MTQALFFVPPSIIMEYSNLMNEETIASFKDLLHGQIAINIKRMVLDEFYEAMEMVFGDIEKAYDMASKAFPKLQQIVTDYAKDSFFDEMEHHISQVASANFRFSMRILLSILQIAGLALTRKPSSMKLVIPEDFIRPIKSEAVSLVMPFSEEMIDATSIESKETDRVSMLSMMLLSFNIMIFLTLVISIAILTEKHIALTEDQKDQVESLLRDWSQEIITQLTLITPDNRKLMPTIKLEGIIPDEEDRDIVEEGLSILNNN